MTRYFTLREAQRLLPAVERALRDGIRSKTEYQEAEAELRSATQRVTMLGGVDLDRDAFAGVRKRREAAAECLREAMRQIGEIGCLVKDLDVGLIDFPTLFRGDEVYLCWKLGEPDIAFWHGVEEGFRGRKPIDRDFLDHHSGGARN